MSDKEAKDQLENFRGELRAIDDDIVRLVARRMEIVRDIGALKRGSGMAVFDQARESFNLKRSLEVAQGKIPDGLVQSLTDLLAAWARDVQSRQK